MYVQVHAYLCVFDCMSVLVCMHACPLYVNLCEVKHETPQAKKKQQNKITTTTKLKMNEPEQRNKEAQLPVAG